ncbi:MAG: hypothetical protein AMXMBFR84_22930 [Candidatus Hydrogenedentota bacterium]
MNRSSAVINIRTCLWLACSLITLVACEQKPHGIGTTVELCSGHSAANLRFALPKGSYLPYLAIKCPTNQIEEIMAHLSEHPVTFDSRIEIDPRFKKSDGIEFTKSVRDDLWTILDNYNFSKMYDSIEDPKLIYYRKSLGGEEGRGFPWYVRLGSKEESICLYYPFGACQNREDLIMGEFSIQVLGLENLPEGICQIEMCIDTYMGH